MRPRPALSTRLSMHPAPIPLEEDQRLARLRALQVLDTPPEPVFDSLARMASMLCGVPIALLCLVDAQRQWFKASIGLDGLVETPREQGLCAHAIQRDAPLAVRDARQDRRFAGHALVRGAPAIRFYAGVPLVLPGGARIGTLCVMDRQVRELGAEPLRQLEALAQVAVQALQMRCHLMEHALTVRSAHAAQLEESEARHRAILDAQSELVSQARADGTLIYVNPAYAQHFGLSVDAILGTSLFDYVEPADRGW
jgi:GAF domain-containing protein